MTAISVDEAIVEIASAVASRVPAANALAPAPPRVVTSGAELALFSTAVVADLVPPMSGSICVLVGSDLVAALSETPAGKLEVADALEPALDAGAEAVGGSTGAPRELSVADALAELGGEAHIVVLSGGEEMVGVLISATAKLSGPESVDAPASAIGPLANATAGVMPGASSARGIEMLRSVVMDVTVELGRARLSVRELLSLAPGEVLELDRPAGSPADLLVNGQLIARGEVVVVGEDFGLRITEVIDGAEVA